MYDLTREDVRAMCIRNQWFTCGTNEQYEKLFTSIDDGRSVEEIALIIWLCSDECWTVAGIAAMLQQEKRDHRGGTV